MKNQALFSSKDKSKKKRKCRLLQFLFGALRVNSVIISRGLLFNGKRSLPLTVGISFDLQSSAWMSCFP